MSRGLIESVRKNSKKRPIEQVRSYTLLGHSLAIVSVRACGLPIMRMKNEGVWVWTQQHQ